MDANDSEGLNHFMTRTAARERLADPASAVARDVAVAAKQGDETAMLYLHVRYAADLYGYVREMVHGDDEAQDVTQEVLLRLPVTIDEFEPSKSLFEHWLRDLARDTARHAA